MFSLEKIGRRVNRNSPYSYTFFLATFYESKIVLKLKLKEKKPILDETFDSEGFGGSYINLLTFKVITDRYVFIAILLLVFW